MFNQSLYHTIQRYRTLQTHKIYALPIVILMPHSACNCRCVMCDIWKGNKNLKQLTENDVQALLSSLKKFGTQQVVMSGGEALLNPNFFALCRLLQKNNISISVLSTGLSIRKHADELSQHVKDIIVSLDGPEALHNEIRNIKDAYQKLREGVQYIKSVNKKFAVSGRTVIHRLNYRQWPAIIEAAKEIGLDRISFLPADVSSQAFNREIVWSEERQHEIMLPQDELPTLKNIIEGIITKYAADFDNRFISESPDKLRKIYEYYAAFFGLNAFPYKKCNAPWVSAVIEADGTVRPCFFHAAVGNIKQQSLDEILNGEKAIQFRKELDMDTNETCIKCVCYLNLPPRAALS